MNYRNKAVLETLIRVKGFSSQPGLPTNARATSLNTQVDGFITAMETAGTSQMSGLGIARFGTGRKRELATGVRELVRKINRTTKGLDEETHPNAEEQFRMPTSRSYQALLATARAFLGNIASVKADLIASGMFANFDETLQGLVTDFTIALQQREGGMGKQVGGTAGLAANEKAAVRVLEKLDATMSNLLENDPSLMGAWKRTVHIQRTPRSDASSSGEVGENSGTGDGSDPAPSNPGGAGGAGSVPGTGATAGA